MKEKISYNRFYEKLVKMQPDKPMQETVEYQVLAKAYPHLAESLRLRKEIERLERESKSLRKGSAKTRIEKEIMNLQTKLKRVNLSKRLHGESRKEASLRMHFRIGNAKRYVSSSAEHVVAVLRNLFGNIRRRLLSNVLDLKSMYAAERSLTIKEWVKTHRKKPERKK